MGKRKKQTKKLVGSMLGPYVSEVEVGSDFDPTPLQNEINSLSQRVTSLESKPSGGVPEGVIAFEGDGDINRFVTGATPFYYLDIPANISVKELDSIQFKITLKDTRQSFSNTFIFSLVKNGNASVNLINSSNPFLSQDNNILIFYHQGEPSRVVLRLIAFNVNKQFQKLEARVF